MFERFAILFGNDGRLYVVDTAKQWRPQVGYVPLTGLITRSLARRIVERILDDESWPQDGPNPAMFDFDTVRWLEECILPQFATQA